MKNKRKKAADEQWEKVPVWLHRKTDADLIIFLYGLGKRGWSKIFKEALRQYIDESDKK